MLTSNLLLLAVLTAPPADQVDTMLAKAHREAGVKTASVCTDEAFLRRITLDLAGRIPTREELREFRGAPDRSAKIEQLLSSKEFPKFWSHVWTASLVGYATRPFNVSREPLRAWLEESLRDEVGYDQIARELISAEGDSAFNGPVNFLLRHRQEPVVKVSRLFLGVRLDCARCHDHPFDKWTREDFDRFNAFFQSVNYREVSERNVRLTETPREANEDELPRFLSGAKPRTSRWRDELALFVTTCKPFARNFANRMWYQMLGRGLVDPPDDFSANKSVSPDLLEYLADRARATDFDVRAMIRVIANSKAYQRDSGGGPDAEMDRELFARFTAKPMTVEQTLNSLETALKLQWTETQRAQRLARLVSTSLDEDYSQTWDYRDTVQDVMTQLVVETPFRESSITSIYERILSRSPSERELKLCRPRPRSQVVFAVIHSNEFRFNH